MNTMRDAGSMDGGVVASRYETGATEMGANVDILTGISCMWREASSDLHWKPVRVRRKHDVCVSIVGLPMGAAMG